MYQVNRASSIRNWVLHIVVLCLVLSSVPISFGAQPGDTPIAWRARQALLAGQYDEALVLYDIAMMSTPDNATMWYNRACALGKLEREGATLQSMEYAFESGYNDSTWASNDSDLVILWGTEEFIDLTTRMAANRREQEAAVLPRHFLQQAMTGHYDVTLPEGYDANKSYPLVMLLHGRGRGCSGVDQLPERLGLDNVIYVEPFAPYPLPGANVTWEYFPHSMARDGEADDALVNTCMKQTTSWHSDIVKDISKNYRIDKKKIIVVGFSQGAWTSYATVCDNAGLFIGAGIMSGWLPEDYLDDGDLKNAAKKGVNFFIGHGREEGSLNLSEEARDKVTAAGAEVTYKTYDAGHWIHDEIVADLKIWVEGLID
jgi:phospholipase/carboxylesterase